MERNFSMILMLKWKPNTRNLLNFVVLLQSLLCRASEDRPTAIEVCEMIEKHLGKGKSTSSTNEKEDLINDADLDAIDE